MTDKEEKPLPLPGDKPFSPAIKAEIYCMIRVTTAQRRIISNRFKFLMQMKPSDLIEVARKCGYESDLTMTSRLIIIGMILQDEYGYHATEDFLHMLQFFK
jgi:hypothetical protein